MTRRLFIFDDPDRFLAGAIGSPGEREFFLQARQGQAVVSLGIEKVQVAALAARLEDLLEAVEAPRTAVPEPADDDLEQPVVEFFRVGAMALAWDPSDEAVVIEAQRPTEDGDYVEVADDDEDGPDLLRVRLAAGAARMFVRSAQALVDAGRPACPFCGEPLDPIGHFCARTTGNGQVS
jgi:uncharacterized repeat protein (TIGR03847 family)